MSHVDSVNPAGPLVVAPGQQINFDVLVSGVPGDDPVVVRWTASDGSTGSAQLTVDRAALEGVLSGTPQGNQVLGQVASGPGKLESVGAIVGGWRFRYTAA